MENKIIEKIAAEICAGIDEGEACINLCHTCRRQAEAAIKVVQGREALLKTRIRSLEGMLLELLEIVVEYEEGAVIKRAQDLLFDAHPRLTLVKDADSV